MNDWVIFDEFHCGGEDQLIPKVEPPKPKTTVQWVVICPEYAVFEEVVPTRAQARSIVKHDKFVGRTSHIERREYQLISSKKVS